MPDEQPELERYRRPRWVIVIAVAALIVLVVVVLVMVIGGDHGPGRHGPQHGSVEAERAQL